MAENPPKIQILCVEKGGEISPRMNAVLGPKRAAITSVRSIDRVLERFEQQEFDILAISSLAPGAGVIKAMDVLEVVSDKSPQTQILFFVEPRDIGLARHALAAGTYQYAKTPIGDEELALLVESALAHRPEFGPNLLLKQPGQQTTFEQMVGGSPAMQAVYTQIRQAASTDIPVFLSGETGTGKDLAAQAIHQLGSRAAAPFLPVHLAALPPELVSSELFGHEKGAFTGATGRYQGSFERAHQGTVFLDEIGTINDRVQVALLRLLEEEQFHRIGGRRKIKADVRVISATNEDLRRSVDKGRFREDLFFRLDVLHIDMPPLRERTGDAPLLIDHFLKRYNDTFNKRILGISAECMALLAGYSWPGNVRELKNVIMRAVVMCSGEVLEVSHLPKAIRQGKGGPPKIEFAIGTPLEDVERLMVEQTLVHTGNNRKRAAEILGISRRALYNKIARWDL
ncbi:MAG: sigma-54 dependent transcriptional regulator [Deltaproteobacteria bacterium]|nr:sigma-54 dependent transcriptional regulator [Deltaproteobacteria bacterium]